MAVKSLCHKKKRPSSIQPISNDDELTKRGKYVIIVEAMVFGLMNSNSGCGIIVSRNFETGENILSG